MFEAHLRLLRSEKKAPQELMESLDQQDWVVREAMWSRQGLKFLTPVQFQMWVKKVGPEVSELSSAGEPRDQTSAAGRHLAPCRHELRREDLGRGDGKRVDLLERHAQRSSSASWPTNAEPRTRRLSEGKVFNSRAACRALGDQEGPGAWH